MKRLIRCILIGGPGAGKGTQTKRIQQDFNFASISSGDLLRAHMLNNTSLGQQASSYINKGRLVPDKLVLELILTQLNSLKDRNWLLDGFPRNALQASALDTTLEKLKQPLSIAIELQVPDEIILQRVQDRWIHAPSGRTYNYSFNPPKVYGRDDVTGDLLTKRSDDNIETFRERLKDYRENSRPLVEHYGKKGLLVTVRGNSSEEIYPKIYETISSAAEKY